MNSQEFQEQLQQTSFGKQLPNAIYLHESALSKLPPALKQLIESVSKALKLDEQWNLVKLHRHDFMISFLSYPNFDEDPYPNLHRSNVVDLNLKKLEHRKYDGNSNPPILHRKETLVSKHYPLYEEFQLITQEGEQAGLYDEPSIIGHKQSWEFLIKQKGYQIVDGRLFRSSAIDNDPEIINRERTAISRFHLSSPFQAAAKLGYLDGRFTILDYGCGRGDDLCILENEGLDAIGWDPNHRPDGQCAPRELVNLGFVINVIEDRKERDEALIRAFANTEKVLLVSAMIASDNQIEKYKPYRDGVLTSRNTFQKYYSQQDLRTYISETLQSNPLTLGTGTFVVFKDPTLELEFLENRYKRVRSWSITGRARKTKEQKLQEIIDEHQELVQAYWTRALELGRFPKAGEFDQLEDIRHVFPSMNKFIDALLEVYDESELMRAGYERREDLILVHAMSVFSGRRIFKNLAANTQTDIRHFFGTFKELQIEAKNLLNSLAETTNIQAGVISYIENKGIGYYEEGKSLTIHRNQVSNLPIVLRAYVGVAQHLYGDLECIDLIKIHIHTGKLSFMGYDGFLDKPIPMLRERIKADLWRIRVDYFDYVDEYEPKPLYWKSVFIDESIENYSKQKNFDERLDLYGYAPRNPHFGMPADELKQRLAAVGFTIRGWRFFKL